MINIDSFKKIGRFKIFKPSEVVCMQNDPGDEMYIVLKGVFGVYINSFTDFPVRVAGIPEGAFFGEMSAIDGWPRSATIISEELGSTISVGKENISELLANSTDIATKILATLSGRAETTAELARKKGKNVLDLPTNLRKIELQSDPKANLDMMIMLAQRVRELNELLGVGGAKSEIEIKQNIDTVMLLPGWHDDFKQSDEIDNSKILANWEYVCPYCRNGFKNRIPLFTRLIEKEKTLDQRVIYSNFNILFYTNIICPNCNYSDTYQEFQKESKGLLKPKVEGNQFKNFEGFTGYANDIQHTLQEAVLSYYLNLECLKQIPNSELREAKAWHKLHWLYTDYMEKKAADIAATRAIQIYTDYLKQFGDDLSAEDFMIINLIIGELYMTMGKHEKAREFFVGNINISGYQSHDLARKSAKRIADIKYM